MKRLFVLVLAMPSFVFAAPREWTTETTMPEARYLSWCLDGSVVHEADGKGVVELANCTATGLRCVEAVRILGGGKRLITASCHK